MAAQEDATMKTLYEASMRGCVSTLNTLIQQDPLTLNKISLTTFTETPLHVSALLGHLDFTKTLLTHKPQLTQELDSCGRTALHLASAEGHREIVHVLLEAAEDACLVRDQDARIPVHYAAMRGRTEVVREFIRAKKDSLRVLDRGNTVMHLCVTYNHLETLKVVVEEDGDTSELLNVADFYGRNTILHLAAMFKQVQTVRYLLSIPKIRAAASSENDVGFTALDIIENTPKDFKSLEIQLLLMDIGIKSKKNIQKDNNHNNSVLPKENYWIKFKKSVANLFQLNPKWMEERREKLGLVATVISTMTFQAALNPPGSVYQEINKNWLKDDDPCTDYGSGSDDDKFVICPGQALSGITSIDEYKLFLIFNTISFVASTTISILLVSGFPIQNRFILWFLTISMCITALTLNAAYLMGLSLTTPDSALDQVYSFFNGLSWFLVIEFLLISLLYVTYLLAWLMWKWIKRVKSTWLRTLRNCMNSIINFT